jgi:hypothetical protein
VAPFGTYGGGGLGNIARDIAQLCPKSTVLEGARFSKDGGPDGEAAVAGWLKKIGLL